jgi:serralysin
MGNKHTEVTSVAVDISLTNVSVGGFAFGGSAGDHLSADGTVAKAALFGGGGNDTIDAGASEKNVVFGGDGNDLIVSGGHADRLEGGASGDTFAFDGMADRRLAFIHDFGGDDQVDLTQLDSDPSTPGLQSWTVVSHFDGDVGEAELRYHASHDRTVVLLDSNGDGHLDHKIELNGERLDPSFLVV